MTVSEFKRKLASRQKFNIEIYYTDGRWVGGNKQGFPEYTTPRMYDGNCTVSDFYSYLRMYLKSKGVQEVYTFEVLYSWGEVAHGNTKLSTVRETY